MLQELLQQEASLLSAHSEITMGKLLSLVEGLDDNLKESHKKSSSKEPLMHHSHSQIHGLQDLDSQKLITTQ